MGYRVDLKGFMARCEANYWRLQRVFPAMDREQSRCVGIAAQGRANAAVNVVIEVTERTPYTTLLFIREERAGSNEVKPSTNKASAMFWAQMPSLKVRLYHDAKLAEVTAFENARRVRPKNVYPNNKMVQRDEKAQWNRFLEEWLSLCIEHGYVAKRPAETFDTVED